MGRPYACMTSRRKAEWTGHGWNTVKWAMAWHYIFISNQFGSSWQTLTQQLTDHSNTKAHSIIIPKLYGAQTHWWFLLDLHLCPRAFILISDCPWTCTYVCWVTHVYVSPKVTVNFKPKPKQYIIIKEPYEIIIKARIKRKTRK